jgi:hypothetical protein
MHFIIRKYNFYHYVSYFYRINDLRHFYTKKYMFVNVLAQLSFFKNPAKFVNLIIRIFKYRRIRQHRYIFAQVARFLKI